MSGRLRGEALLIVALVVSGGGMMALLDGAHGLLGGWSWVDLGLALGGGLLLFFSLLVALFLIYQLDRRSGRIHKVINLFEVEPAQPVGGEEDG